MMYLKQIKDSQIKNNLENEKTKQFTIIEKSKNCSLDLIEKCENKCNINEEENDTKEKCLQNNVLSIDPSQVNINQNTITILNHNLQTGDTITYQNKYGDNIDGLVDKQTYFVYKIDNNTIQLCSTKKDAIDLIGKYKIYQLYGYLNNDGFYRNTFGNFEYNGIPKQEYVTGLTFFEQEISDNIKKGRYLQFQVDNNSQVIFIPESKILDIKEFTIGGKTRKLIQISFQNSEDTNLKKVTLLPDSSNDNIIDLNSTGNKNQQFIVNIYKWIKSNKIRYENNCVDKSFINCDTCKKTMGSDKCINVCSLIKRGFQNYNCTKEQEFECEQKGQLCYDGNNKINDYCVDNLENKRACEIRKEMNYSNCGELCFDKHSNLLKLGLEYVIYFKNQEIKL